MTQNNIDTNDIPNIIPYNTGMRRIDLPEYGRNVQALVDFCVTIEDRDERLRCAKGIVKIMAKLSGKGTSVNDPKLWDHLNILSGFRLDIDFPCDVTTAETINQKPAKLPYGSGAVLNRAYGSNINQLIDIACGMEQGEEKDDLIYSIANQMKKFLTLSNNESVSDLRIFHDIEMISGGKIIINPEQFRLNEYVAPVTIGKNKNKKKKK